MSDSTSERQPPPAPLEASDPERAGVLKMKIRARVADVRRHLIALRTAMADFGENFELEAFRSAHASADPQALNRAKAVERGVDQLYNYIAELAACGLELAELRSRGQETNARRDLQALADNHVLSADLVKRLQRLRELRRLLVHEYATATAEEIHESARIVSDAFPLFYNAYVEWIRQGFVRDRAQSATATPMRSSR